MSDQNPDPQILDDDPDGPEDRLVRLKRSDIKALEAAAKKGRDAEDALAQAEAAKRELVFARAGIDTESEAGRIFMRGYDGELDTESVRTSAASLGIGSTSQPSSQQQPAGDLPPSGTTIPIGDTPLDPGEADLTGQRQSVAAGAPPDQGVQLDPYQEAIDVGREVIKGGGKVEEGFGTAFAKLVRAAHDGDQRVILNRNSVAAREQ